MAAGSRIRFRGFTWSVAILGITFLGIQFIRPELKNMPATADLQVPPQVKQILKTSCYNCHSNETTLSWLTSRHPRIGRLSGTSGRKEAPEFFRDWQASAWSTTGHTLRIVSQIELGAMPLPAYKRLHPKSVVTPEQLMVLKSYLTPVRCSIDLSRCGCSFRASGVR